MAKHKVVDLWCCLGDFNLIRDRTDGKEVGGYLGREDMQMFNPFIQLLGLVNLPLFGTWVQPNSGCMSWLNLILVSNNWQLE